MNKNKKMLVEGENMEKIDAVYVDGKVLYLEIPPQLDNSGYGEDGVAWYAKAHDSSGLEYEVCWDYIIPDWYVNEEETPTNGDCSDFADWVHPTYAREL